METNLFVYLYKQCLVFAFSYPFLLAQWGAHAEILDPAATWTCGGSHVSSHRPMPIWQKYTKSKVDESISVWVQEASGFKLDWFYWLWETAQSQCLWTPAVTNLLQTRHPVVDDDPNGRHTWSNWKSSSPVWRPLKGLLQGLPSFLKHCSEIVCVGFLKKMWQNNALIQCVICVAINLSNYN